MLNDHFLKDQGKKTLKKRVCFEFLLFTFPPLIT